MPLFRKFTVTLFTSYLVTLGAFVLVFWALSNYAEFSPLWAGVGGVAVATGLGATMAYIISGGLHEVVKIATTISEGDLTQQIDYKARDEFGELAAAFNRMTFELSRMVQEIKSTGFSVAQHASGLSELSSELVESNALSTKKMDEIAVSAFQQLNLIRKNEELIGTVSRSSARINEISEETYSLSQQTQDSASTGSEMAESAQELMQTASSQIRDAVRNMKGFHLGLRRIGDLVKRINNIAEQTHILAINATIEAKRAGEAGIGFSVIANEVRRLSDDVRSFSSEITGLSTEIISNAERVIHIVSEGSDSLDNARGSVNKAGSAHTAVYDNTLAIFERVKEIYKLIQDQTTTTDTLVRGMNEIARLAEDYSSKTQESVSAIHLQTESTSELAEKAEFLTSLSRQLEDSVETFKVSDDVN